MAEEKKGILAGFKDFVMKGNVIDLAVAVVVGTAFTALVKSFTDGLITPVLNAFGAKDIGAFGFCVRAGAAPCTSANPTFINFSAMLTAIITFLITMAVLYFVFLVPMEKARALARIAPKAKETPDDVLLLTEIRDLLKVQAGPAGDAVNTDFPKTPQE